MLKEPNLRYANFDASKSLAKKLKINDEDISLISQQCYSNVKKLKKFIDIYPLLDSEDEKFILIKIIMESLNEYLNLTFDEPKLDEFDNYWFKVKKILFDDFVLHAYTIYEWYETDSKSLSNCSLLSYFVRGLNVDFNTLDSL